MSNNNRSPSHLNDHDDGLCHDHHWAREMRHDRSAYPRVADTARIATPSSAMHDDAHYSF